MYSEEIAKYSSLNKIAETTGAVIFGGTDDLSIPTGELRQAFGIDTPLYNRSFKDLSVKDGIGLFDSSILPLHPETVLLHIGDADLEFFTENSAEFACRYSQLIAHIRKQIKKCSIIIVSLRNDRGSSAVSAINEQLRYIASSEKCEFFNISENSLHNPQAMKQITFLHNLGFERRLPYRQPQADLAKILFSFI